MGRKRVSGHCIEIKCVVHARSTFGHALYKFLQVAGETGGCGKFCVAMIQQPVSLVTLAGVVLAFM